MLHFFCLQPSVKDRFYCSVEQSNQQLLHLLQQKGRKGIKAFIGSCATAVSSSWTKRSGGKNQHLPQER